MSCLPIRFALLYVSSAIEAIHMKLSRISLEKNMPAAVENACNGLRIIPLYDTAKSVFSLTSNF